MLTLLNEQRERLDKLEKKSSKRKSTETTTPKKKTPLQKLNDELSSSSSDSSSDNESGKTVVSSMQFVRLSGLIHLDYEPKTKKSKGKKDTPKKVNKNKNRKSVEDTSDVGEHLSVSNLVT